MDAQIAHRAHPLKVQTLLRQSDKAAQRTSLTIHGQRPDDIHDMSIFNDEDWNLVEAALGRVSVSNLERAEWLSDIRKGLNDALMALELTLLPNVESLDFQDVFGYINEEHKWYGKVVEKVAESQHGTDESKFLLPKLKNASLVYWDTENGMDIDHLVVLMSVKSVQQLDAFMVQSEGWEALPDMSSSVKELSLGLACINSKALGDLIQWCPQLEKFSYQTGSSIVGDSILIPSDLSPALATLKPCLQELNIIDDDEEGMRDWHQEDEDPEAPMASFADFEKLHTLSLRACMVLGNDENEDNDMGRRTVQLVDVLPKSLKKLSLDHCGSGILGQLEELLVRKEELTPVLEWIQVAIKENCQIDKEAAQMLANRFMERNIHLNILACCGTRTHNGYCAKPEEIHAQAPGGTLAQQLM